ncbi:MAG: phosphate signaling complex protein PhoU [Anaerolineales bacterium]|nr:phosphate signaling complex protein PhoU [Anaerolineales bacterium]
MTIRSTFDRELSDMDDNILKLSSMAESSMYKALEALTSRNELLAREVVIGDEQINELRYEIEQKGMQMLAMQQPTASDLRHILAALYIANELERIGDHAKGIARLVSRLDEQPEELNRLPKMAKRAHKMLRHSIQAYLTRDVERAEQVIERDSKLDSHYQRLTRDLFEELDDPNSNVQMPTYLLWVGHNFERIGDRVANIAERVIFMVENRYVELDV